MPVNYRTRLMSIVDREIAQQGKRPAPVARTFKGVKVDLAKFDQTWDRKRGSAIRLTSVLLREGDDQLKGRVCENDTSAKTYASAVNWLTKEAEHLRKCSKMHEMAVARLTAVLARCGESASAN